MHCARAAGRERLMANEFLEDNGETLQSVMLACRVPLRAELSQCVRSSLRFGDEMVIERFDPKMRLIALKATRGTGGELMEAIRIGLREMTAQGHPCGFMHVHPAADREILDHRQCAQFAKGAFALFRVQLSDASEDLHVGPFRCRRRLHDATQLSDSPLLASTASNVISASLFGSLLAACRNLQELTATRHSALPAH